VFQKFSSRREKKKREVSMKVKSIFAQMKRAEKIEEEAIAKAHKPVGTKPVLVFNDPDFIRVSTKEK
jgi:hypothetical protein